MPSSTATIATPNGAKYVRQLSAHWSHKLEVDLDDTRSIIQFPESRATLTPGPNDIQVTIEAPDRETFERMQEVVAVHLDRFAFREAPLHYDWKVAAPSS